MSNDLKALAKSDSIIIIRTSAGTVDPENLATRVGLNYLPKAKISTAFEPHLRHSSVRKIQTLMSEFRHSVGRPEISTIREELKGTLADTYRQAVLSPETRTFATAVSMLQDFLRPHWSSLPEQQLIGIDAKLVWLDSQQELGPATLTKFYRDLVSVLGAQISLNASTDEADEAAGESDE